MTTATERYANPRSLDEAVQLLSEGPATVLAGGTDLMPGLRAGTRELAPTVLNVKHVPQLQGVSEVEGALRIGALVTIGELCRSDTLLRCAKVLPDAADCFASSQIRNIATLGGNLCNASPAADMAIPLLLLDAEVELASWDGAGVACRRLPLADFFVGPGRTAIRDDELLCAVHFAVPEADWVARFTKHGTRPALDIAIVSIGVAGRKSNGALHHARVAFGAVAPTPIRGRKTERVIAGQVLDDATVETAAKAAGSEVAPISDVRASAWYRTELVETLTRRALQHVAGM